MVQGIDKTRFVAGNMEDTIHFLLMQAKLYQVCIRRIVFQ